MKVPALKSGLYLRRKYTKALEVQSTGSIVTGKKVEYSLCELVNVSHISLVSTGDRVLRGQKIAREIDVTSAPIYSAVSGQVIGIEKKHNTTGVLADCIVIENDEKYETVYSRIDKAGSSIDLISRNEIIKAIRMAGVREISGGSASIFQKLALSENVHIIINGLECEPFLSSSSQRILENSEELFQGLRILLKLFRNTMIIFAIAENRKDCRKLLNRLFSKEPFMKLELLQRKYPQGEEKLLIQSIMKKYNSLKKTPAKVDCFVLDVEDVLAIYQAVVLGEPKLERMVTVGGTCIANPGEYLVSIGTTYEELIEATGGFTEEPQKVIIGGAMTGIALANLEASVTKRCSGVIALKEDELLKNPTTSCVNCGRCILVCPRQLIPSMLAHLKPEDEVRFKYLGGEECLGCGSCSYTCPAKIEIAHSIDEMKQQIAGKNISDRIIKKDLKNNG